VKKHNATWSQIGQNQEKTKCCCCVQAACGLFDDLQAYKEVCMYEQQGFQPPPGLHKTALRNQAALDTLLNQQMAQQETKSGSQFAAELIAAADELSDLAPHVTKVDLLRHSHAVCQDDFLAAVDSLYKYFDYSTGESFCHHREPAAHVLHRLHPFFC